MDQFLNTPRRVTRASMAALSASKNSPNLLVASPVTTTKKTPAAKKRVAAKTPTASTGKRGRGRPASTVKSLETEGKENIPSSSVGVEETEKISTVRKLLDLTNSNEITSVEEESKQEGPAMPKIKLTEASFIAGVEAIVTDEKVEEKDTTKTKGTFDETLNFSRLEGKGIQTPSKKDKKSAVVAAPKTAILQEKPGFDETLNFSKLEHNIDQVSSPQKEEPIFDDTLNFSKLEAKGSQTPSTKHMKSTVPAPEGFTDLNETPNFSKLKQKIEKVDRVPAPKKGERNFDETLAFSKLEENCAKEADEKNQVVVEIEMDEICFIPPLLKENPKRDTITVSEEEPVIEVEKLELVDIPETIDLCDSPMISYPDPKPMNDADSGDIGASVTTNEDEYLLKLCSEAEKDVINGHPVSMEETLNGTFEVDDSVFGASILLPAETPVLNSNKTFYNTIVIEDTPLKPKTPQITMRRPFRKQQHVDGSDTLSVSCVTGEKSILKRKKRSLSTGDISINFTMQERRVKFNSPANMTVEINEIDERLIKGFIETNGRHQRAARRKRSLSDADYTLLKSEKAESTRKAFRSKKMPDFAAIHSKAINKMESIADNLARKQERAIQLITPNKAKQAPSDMERDSTPSKKQKLESNTSDISICTESVPSSVVIESKPTMPYVSEEKSEEMYMEELDPVVQPEASEPIEEAAAIELTEATSPITELLEPVEPVEIVKHRAVIVKPIVVRPLAKIAPQKPMEKVQLKHKLQFGGARPPKHEGQRTPVFSFAAKCVLAGVKAGKDTLVNPGNLNTQLHNVTHGPTTSNNSTMELPTTSRTATKVKESREERHKNMYKANRLLGDGRRNGEILKGVRLNKRFMLQMASRKVKDQNQPESGM